jgi:hypothetical protein
MGEKYKENSAVHQNSFTTKYFILKSSFGLAAINFPRGIQKEELQSRARKDKN